MDGPFQTPGAMTKIAGMAFMAVHDGQGDAAIVRQCLIAFQAPVDLVNRFPQRARIHLGVYVSHGFGAGHGMAQPMLPEAGCARHLQSVEASHPRPEQDHGGFGYRGRGDARLRSAAMAFSLRLCSTLAPTLVSRRPLPTVHKTARSVSLAPPSERAGRFPRDLRAALFRSVTWPPIRFRPVIPRSEEHTS